MLYAAGMAGRPKGRKDSYPRKRRGGPYGARGRSTASDTTAVASAPMAPFNPDTFDPVVELKKIAVDRMVVGPARVAAIKLLLDLGKPAVGDRTPIVDRVTAKAIELMARTH
jgi:hypothetical protein